MFIVYWVSVLSTGDFGVLKETETVKGTYRCEYLSSVLRIRNVYPGFWIPDPNFSIQDQKDSGSRIPILIKEFILKFFDEDPDKNEDKKYFLALLKLSEK
jgi:hypothetical protein